MLTSTGTFKEIMAELTKLNETNEVLHITVAYKRTPRVDKVVFTATEENEPCKP